MIKLLPPGAGYERITEAVSTEWGQLIELLRSALMERLREPGKEYTYIEMVGIYADRVVARHKGRLWSFPYKVAADNSVAFETQSEVVATYTPVREAAAGATDLADFREAADGSIECTVVRAGASRNGNFYPDSALREAVAMFEGARVFCKADAEHLKGGAKDVRNLIGGLYGVRFVEGAKPDTGRLVATFRPIVDTDPVVQKMTEAVRKGLAGLMGLSIDATARTRREQRDGRAVRVAERFVRVDSVDLIVEPGAGGSLDRLAEADDPAARSSISTPPEHSGETMLITRLIEAVALLSASHAAGLDPATSSEQLVTARLAEACKATGVSLGDALAAAVGEDSKPALQRLVEAARTAAATAQATRLAEAANAGNAPVTRAELEMFRTRQVALQTIAACGLPAPARDRLAARFGVAERFTEAEVTQAIKDERDYLSRFAEASGGAVRLGDLARITVEDRARSVSDMLDAFFDPAHKEHRAVRSFKECYFQITGDRHVTGRLRDADRTRLLEASGEERFSEAVISSTFANALGDSITRRMQAIFTGLVDLQTWRRVATVTPVMDFRTQTRVRIGGYGNLPTVAQGAAYAALTSPSDEAATYAVAKRGGLETVTLEAIKNDDVGAIRRIPTEMALAAANTLYEFVWDFYRTNPTIYDGAALYTAPKGNLFTAALSAAQYSAHRLAMAKMTRAGSGKRMAVTPAILAVPFDLQEMAFDTFVRSTNNDKTFVQNLNPTVIPVGYWTDTNDWVTVADPNVLPVLEIGFLDGREEPETFVQDSPSVGSMFSNDILTYKIRHIYGGNVLVDGFKGTTKAVVP